MTTIAYRDGMLACDSGMTCDHIRVGKTEKAWEYKGFIITGCGYAADLYAFRDWFVRGMKGDCPEPREDGTLVIITPDRSVLIREPAGWIRGRSSFYAWGSGFSLAIGAMAAGASAVRAVEIACEHDCYSQGPVMRFIQDDLRASNLSKIA